jgi:hypothetical protein
VKCEAALHPDIIFLMSDRYNDFQVTGFGRSVVIAYASKKDLMDKFHADLPEVPRQLKHHSNVSSSLIFHSNFSGGET